MAHSSASTKATWRHAMRITIDAWLIVGLALALLALAWSVWR